MQRSMLCCCHGVRDDVADADDGEEPFFEMCVHCEQLAAESQSRLPNAFVSISYQSPPQQQWVTHGHTEIIEVCSAFCINTVSE